MRKVRVRRLTTLTRPGRTLLLLLRLPQILGKEKGNLKKKIRVLQNWLKLQQRNLPKGNL